MPEDKNVPEESGKTYIFDDPKNVKRLLLGFYIICGLLIAADFIVHRHIYTPLEKIPVFYALYGFGAYVLLVVVSVLLRMVVMRKENYYDE